MKPDSIRLRDKRLMQNVVGVSAKVADALELSQKAKELSANSNTLLIGVQKELEQFYLALSDDVCDNEKSDS